VRPVFGATILLEELEAFLSPGVVRRDALAFADDAVDFRPEQNFVHDELIAGAHCGGRFVANLQNGGA